MTYNPQSGTNWPAGLETGSSFAGIIAAFNDIRVQRGQTPKEYQDNFGGIIAAIQDLLDLGNVTLSELPPNWDLTYDGSNNITGGDFTYTPPNGHLWFDTRTGRLMVWDTNAYYQTNGADGLTAVSANQPTREVEGALWFNNSNQNLYIYYSGTWNLAIATNAVSLPALTLSAATQTYYGTVNPLLVNVSQFTPATASDRNQSVLNRWIIQAVRELDAAIETNEAAAIAPAAASAPTTSLKEGDLYFNTGDLNLYVYNTISGNAAWRHVINPTNFSDDRLKAKDGDLTETLDKLGSINAFYYYENDLAKELGFRNGDRQLGLSAQELKEVLPEVVSIAAFDRELDPETGKFKSRSSKNYLTVDYEKLSAFTLQAIKELVDKVDHKASQVDFDIFSQDLLSKTNKANTKTGRQVNELAAYIGDIDDYVKKADLSETNDVIKTLQEQVDAVDSKEIDFSALATTKSVTEGLNELQESLINLHKSTEIYVDQRIDLVKESMPDKEILSTKSELKKGITSLDQKIKNKKYLSQKGGDIFGRFEIKNSDIELPTFDFSASASDSQKALRFRSNTGEDSIVDFGTTQSFWEYAWEFKGEEDFCWNGPDGKVFSVDRNGAACTKLIIGQFSENNEHGRVIHNHVDVGERLHAYQTTFEGIRAALANSEDFETFKQKATRYLKEV